MFRILIVLILFALIFQPPLMTEEKVVIAVASDGETLKARVSHLAARTPYFLYVDRHGKLFEFKGIAEEAIKKILEKEGGT
jgi:hypothetical protein